MLNGSNTSTDMTGNAIPPLSIVILSRNARRELAECIQSIRDTVSKGTYEIIVVDNASTDGVRDWLRSQGDVKLIENSENKSFSEGNNQGIKAAASGNDILLLNNDTVVFPGAIDAMRRGLYVRPTVGAVSCLTNAGGDQVVDRAFRDKNDYLSWWESEGLNECAELPDPYENRVWLMGFALMIKRSALDRVGLLDEDYFYGFEDDDIGYRLTKEGYELLLCHDSFIFHYGSLSIEKEGADASSRFYDENHERFLSKWGFDIPVYTSVRSDLSGLVEHPGTKPFRVFEIGCGCGCTLANIKYKYRDAHIYGVEKNRTAAFLSKYFGHISCLDAEKDEFTYQEKFFDCLLLGDVLEEMEDPDAFLEKIVKYLKPGAQIIVSTRNSMFIPRLVSIIKGETRRISENYYDFSGIVTLFKEHGYEIGEFYAQPGRIPDSCSAYLRKLPRLPGAADREEFTAFRYVFRAYRQ
ncbi:MAG: glycosyltransferase [Lachnospiraceae bacterium]|nr:glycosyltransferase [Lachnospiraceae bacterium]